MGPQICLVGHEGTLQGLPHPPTASGPPKESPAFLSQTATWQAVLHTPPFWGHSEHSASLPDIFLGVSDIKQHQVKFFSSADSAVRWDSLSSQKGTLLARQENLHLTLNPRSSSFQLYRPVVPVPPKSSRLPPLEVTELVRQLLA